MVNRCNLCKENEESVDHISAVKVQEGEDSLVWKIERRGKFSVKSYYRSLKDENSPFFPAKEVWGSHAPFRTRFFLLGKQFGVKFLLLIC